MKAKQSIPRTRVEALRVWRDKNKVIFHQMPDTKLFFCMVGNVSPNQDLYRGDFKATKTEAESSLLDRFLHDFYPKGLPKWKKWDIPYRVAIKILLTPGT